MRLVRDQRPVDHRRQDLARRRGQRLTLRSWPTRRRRRRDLGDRATRRRLAPPAAHPPRRLQDPQPQRTDRRRPHERGPKDVVYVGENERVRVLIQFERGTPAVHDPLPQPLARGPRHDGPVHRRRGRLRPHHDRSGTAGAGSGVLSRDDDHSTRGRHHRHSRSTPRSDRHPAVGRARLGLRRWDPPGGHGGAPRALVGLRGLLHRHRPLPGGLRRRMGAATADVARRADGDRREPRHRPGLGGQSHHGTPGHSPRGHHLPRRDPRRSRPSAPPISPPPARSW